MSPEPSPQTIEPDTVSGVSTFAELREAYTAYKAKHPRAHRRDAAHALGVPEATLLAATADEVVRLDDERWGDLVIDLPQLGQVKTMTRNEDFVIEQNGVYDGIELFGQVGQGVEPGFDLRIFMARWGAAFAVREETARGTRRSIQIFDRAGDSAHKCFIEPEEGVEAFATLVAEFRAAEQPGSLEFTPFPSRDHRNDEDVDQDALRRDWDAMQDTHDFFGLLGRHRVARTQALRLVSDAHAERVRADVFEAFLETVSATGLPIMIFVGNPGMIQIFSGSVRRVVRARGWLNILDPGFNLHARDDQVAEAWIVRKPVPEGIVTSLELYNAEGEDLAILFSVREDGEEECDEWRQLLAALPRAEP